jgi:hypothetical protein
VSVLQVVVIGGSVLDSVVAVKETSISVSRLVLMFHIDVLGSALLDPLVEAKVTSILPSSGGVT